MEAFGRRRSMVARGRKLAVLSFKFRRREKITQRRPDRVGVNAERRGSQRRMERERQTERAQKAQRLQTREKRK
jgi:hypothetical protein